MNMNGNKIFKKRMMLLALTAAGATLFLLWSSQNTLPRWIDWNGGTYYTKSGAYEILLRRKSVQVSQDGMIIWTSPESVKVQELLSCDIDNDSEEELILLCWKKGRYGRLKPFWVEKDETTWSQHIFVYEYESEGIRPKWMSSYIGQDVAHLSSNGKAAPQSRLLLTAPDGKVSSWVWNSWGFSKEDTEVSFTVLGDNLIHEPIYRYGLQQEKSFDFLFENLQDVISKSDVAVINQETPLTDNPSLYSDYPRFGTPVGVGQAIIDAGFDVVTCATNHALDKGAYGINFTRDFFISNHVTCLGIQTESEPEDCPFELITRKGIRFAMLNYTYGTNGIKLPCENPYMVHILDDEKKIRNDIDKARSQADFVIVFVHWGTEDQTQTDAFQEHWAQVFLESRADVVIGTHPHALQPYEILTNSDGHKMLVYYSIGNYISAQPEKSCVKGGMAYFTVSLTSDGYQITEYGLQPLSISWQEGGRYVVAPAYHILQSVYM